MPLPSQIQASGHKRARFRPSARLWLVFLLVGFIVLLARFLLEPVDYPEMAPPGFEVAALAASASGQTAGAVRDLPAGLQPATAEQIRQAVHEALAGSYAKVPDRPGESRHQLAQRLRAGSLVREAASAQKDLVVLAFEGTGSFAPRMAPLMQAAAARLRARGLMPTGSPLTLQYAAFKAMQKRNGQEPNWSGLLTGPLEALLRDPELQVHSHWLSFPSEEHEVFSQLTGLESIPYAQVSELMLGLEPDATPGVDAALLALRERLIQAKAKGQHPHFVIVSHSSGARSAIKFLHAARGLSDVDGSPLRFKLVLSVDPVREAHLVLTEALSELRRYWIESKLNRLRGWLDALPLIKLPVLTVASPIVRQPAGASLTVPANVDHWQSFYQRQDLLGLRVGPRFGIHGSQVTGAQNREVSRVGPAGHGEIAFGPEVSQALVSHLHALL